MSESHSESCLTLCKPMDCIEFSRQKYWSGEPFLSLGDLPNPGVKPRSPSLQADPLPVKPQGKLSSWVIYSKFQKNMLSSLLYLLWCPVHSMGWVRMDLVINICQYVNLTWVWANSVSWWWAGKHGVLQSRRSQIQTWLSDWTELNL